MKRPGRRGSLALLALVAGCTGAPAQRQPGQSAAIEPRPEPLGVVELPEVEQPPGVHAWMRLSAPGRTLKELGAWAPLPGAALRDPELIVAGLSSPRIAELVELDAAVDVTFGLYDRSVVVAWTPRDPAALTSGRARGVRLSRRESGRAALALDEDPRARAECELWNAAPPIGARIVCGSSAELVAYHAPYLLGSKARQAVASDVWLEVGGEEFGDLLSALAEQIAEPPTSDESPAEAFGQREGEELVESFLRDLSGMAGSLSLGGDALEAGFELRFRSRESAATRWLLARQGKGPPPAAFWRLPADSDLAFYWEGSDELGRASAAEFARELVAALREEYEMSEAYAAEFESALLGLFPERGAVALAFGQDRLSLDQELRVHPSPPASSTGLGEWTPPNLTRLKKALGGWWLIALETPPASYLAAVEHLCRVGNKKLEKRRPAAEEAEKGVLYQLRLKDPELPAGSLHFVYETRANPKYRRKRDEPPATAYDTHFFVVPQRERVWISIARDEKRARDRAFYVTTEQAVATLRDVEALGAMSGGPASALSALRLAGLVSLGITGDTEEEREAGLAELAKLHSLPERGKVPVPLWITADGAGAQLRTRLTKAAATDLFMWFILSE